MDLDINLIVEKMKQDLDLTNASLSDSYFYDSISLCVIDSVYSISIKYDFVLKVIKNYCDYYKIQTHRNKKDDVFDKPSNQDNLKNLVDRIENSSPEKFAEEIFKSRHRTSTSSGILKSEAVLKFAKCLIKNGINTFDDVSKLENNADVENEIKQIPGQTSGISYKYFLMLAGNEDFVKPDRMITRYLENITEKILTEDEKIQIIRNASAELIDNYGVTPRGLDHEIWKFQRENGIEGKSKNSDLVEESDEMSDKTIVYNIRIEGKGGKISLSKITKKQYEYWVENQDDLVDHLTTDDGFNNTDKDLRLIEDATYWDEGNIIVASGPEMDENSLLVVEDEDGNEVFSCKMDNDLLEEKGVVLDEDHDENMLDNVTYFYDMRHYEKGALVNAEVELTGEFDPSKLKIVYNETYDWYLVTSISYDGEELDNDASGDSMGMEASVFNQDEL